MTVILKLAKILPNIRQICQKHPIVCCALRLLSLTGVLSITLKLQCILDITKDTVFNLRLLNGKIQ